MDEQRPSLPSKRPLWLDETHFGTANLGGASLGRTRLYRAGFNRTGFDLRSHSRRLFLTPAQQIRFIEFHHFSRDSKLRFDNMNGPQGEVATAMIHMLTTRDHAYTISPVAGAWRRPVKARTFEWLFRQTAIPGGTWIFTDMERLAGYELDAAAYAATALRDAGNRVLNHPAHMLDRAELLHTLHREGINEFAASRAAENPRPRRFPVLLKADNDHRQAHADLIGSQAELEAKLEALRTAGLPLRHLLVIEFANDPLRDGVYRKHSVFRVGERYLSFTPVIEDNWAVKYGKSGLSTDAELDEAIAEVNGNPYAQLLKPAFEAAGIEYGRADFGFHNGRLAVFEINSNPQIPKLKHKHRRKDYADALGRVAAAVSGAIAELDTQGITVRLDWPGKTRKLRGWTRDSFLLRP